MAKTKVNLPIGCAIPFAILFLSAIPAWITHLYVCFTDERWGFLIAGAIAAPIAVVHGWGIWLGVW